MLFKAIYGTCMMTKQQWRRTSLKRVQLRIIDIFSSYLKDLTVFQIPATQHRTQSLLNHEFFLQIFKCDII